VRAIAKTGERSEALGLMVKWILAEGRKRALAVGLEAVSVQTA
jgi:hypothetical protein